MDELTFVPFEKRYYYPGMAPRDVAIWERFIAENPNAFEEVAYNVAVGEGASFDTTVNPENGGNINRLYQRKIDVIGRVKNSYIIVEVKPRASTAALGQVKGYAYLFERDFKLGGTLNTLVVTDQLLPEMEVLGKSEGVNIVIV